MPSRWLEIKTTDLLPVQAELDKLPEILHLEVNEHTYPPKVGMFKHDWVAGVGFPAFLAYAAEYRHARPIRSFCSVGTGAGIDALAALECFDLDRVVVTDIHPDIVSCAVRNIKRSCLEGGANAEVTGYSGDLLTPLPATDEKFDLIYENLPNIPASADMDILRLYNSSSFVSRPERAAPDGGAPLARGALLELHCALLEQARPLLSPEGRVLCSIGSRASLDKIQGAIAETGYKARPLVFTWKVQTEAPDVVAGYAEYESQGLGPFHFYPLSILIETFRGISPAQGAARAWELEERLHPWRLTAAEGHEIVLAGGEVGHTAVIMEAVPAES
jgi:methylase of polypeptide subunit release factors